MSRPRRSAASPTVPLSDIMDVEREAAMRVGPSPERTLDSMVEAILKYRVHYIRGADKPKVSCIDIFETYVDEHELDWRESMPLLALSLAVAKSWPQYYGVLCTISEQYCSRCRKVLPVHNFVNSSVTCEGCKEGHDEVQDM